MNDAGSSGWSPEVTVKTCGGPPGAPTDVKARATSPTTVLATWRAPDTDGEITGYTLTYVLRSIGECGPSSATKPITKHSREERIELDDLVPDSTYDIYVVAHTTTEGPKSKVVTVRTEESGELTSTPWL